MSGGRTTLQTPASRGRWRTLIRVRFLVGAAIVSGGAVRLVDHAVQAIAGALNAASLSEGFGALGVLAATGLEGMRSDPPTSELGALWLTLLG